ncbi:conserved Plasmodium protein, unknown function [Plasmodium sp. gorilla clade G3]|nr:conserved Plasmodium protein, unknown function [Plasmodium sp. gorilla clade G3]
MMSCNIKKRSCNVNNSEGDEKYCSKTKNKSFCRYISSGTKDNMLKRRKCNVVGDKEKYDEQIFMEIKNLYTNDYKNDDKIANNDDNNNNINNREYNNYNDRLCISCNDVLSCDGNNEDDNFCNNILYEEMYKKEEENNFYTNEHNNICKSNLLFNEKKNVIIKKRPKDNLYEKVSSKSDNNSSKKNKIRRLLNKEYVRKFSYETDIYNRKDECINGNKKYIYNYYSVDKIFEIPSDYKNKDKGYNNRESIKSNKSYKSNNSNKSNNLKKCKNDIKKEKDDFFFLKCNDNNNLCELLDKDKCLNEEKKCEKKKNINDNNLNGNIIKYMNTSSIGNKSILYDKEYNISNRYEKNFDEYEVNVYSMDKDKNKYFTHNNNNNNNNNSQHHNNYIKSYYNSSSKRSETIESIQSVKNIRDMKDSIYEKKKKIKSIHNKILRLIKEDNNKYVENVINDNLYDKSDKHTKYEKNENNKKKELYNNNNSMNDKEYKKNDDVLEINKCDNENNMRDTICNNKTHMDCNIYNNNDVDMVDDDNNFHDEEIKKRNIIMDEEIKECEIFIDEKSKNDKKIYCTKKYKKLNLSHTFLNNIKLIYEKKDLKEKKKKYILIVNKKCLEKYSYFNTIVNTYCKEKDSIKMDSYINYKLSKILFCNNIIKQINIYNFKKIMKALDFYGYSYDNIFLKNLCNKIIINKWLKNDTFFHKILISKRFLNVALFFDLIYNFLYKNSIFLKYFFSFSGGRFMKSFIDYNKNKALKLINKIIKNIKDLNPSTSSVIDFLCGFYSNEEKEMKYSKSSRRNYLYGIKDKNIIIQKKTNDSRKKSCDTYIYMKNKKYNKKVLGNIINNVWLKTDMFIKESIYYGKNFSLQKNNLKKKQNTIYNMEKIENFLYDKSERSYSSMCTKSTNENFYQHDIYENQDDEYLDDPSSIDDEKELENVMNNFYSSNDLNINFNEHMSESINQCIYNQSENVNFDNNIPDDTQQYGDDYIGRHGNHNKTFQSFEGIPNMAFDLYTQDDNNRSRRDTFISLCFKEEEKCNTDKYVKDISFLGIGVRSKENKINDFNCFNINLKIMIRDKLLSKIKCNISKSGKKISPFFPVWPNIPDFFGYKIFKNIKKDIKRIQKKNITMKMKQNSLDIINNKKKYKNIICEDYEKVETPKKKKKLNEEEYKLHNNNNNNIIIKLNNTKLINIDEIKLNDLHYILNIKIYPIRTLLLYILYNSFFKDYNNEFIEFFCNSINSEIKEWLLLFLLPNFIYKSIHKVTYPLKLTKNIFSESSEFYEDFFSNEYLKMNDIEKIIIYTKNCNEEHSDICPFLFCYLWLKSNDYKIDKWISSKINEMLFTFPYANFLLSKYFSNFLLFIQLFRTSLDIDHMYLCKSHFYVSLKHNISFIHESLVNVLFSTTKYDP